MEFRLPEMKQFTGTKKAVTFLQVQIFQSASSQLHSGNYNLEMENGSCEDVFPIEK